VRPYAHGKRPTRPGLGALEAGRGWGRTRDLREVRPMPKRVMSQKLPAAVSPLDAFGGRATREHRIRVRNQ
jgi:hypothetical protein